MLRITESITIDEGELQIDFVRASGPGGQNVNKVSTAAQLRFNAAHSPSLPEEVRSRLIALAGSRITTEGMLVIEARRFRTQEQNRSDAIDRFTRLLQQAAKQHVARRVTRPSAASRAARLQAKRRRGEVKRERRLPHEED